MPDSSEKVVFRSVMGWVWLALAGGVSLFLIGDMAVRGGAWDAFLVAPWLLAVCWLVWVFQVVPRIVADGRGVRLHNLLRIVDLPWSAVAGVRLRYSAEFDLRAGGKITAWGGHSRRMHLQLKRASSDPAEDEVAQLERLHAEAEADDRPVERSWNVGAIAAGALIVCWIAFALTVTGGPVLPG
ncbi:PH domain-containing protein [Microbacterium sp. G2-8]|uniref:PH domain-containing protein n=1 Tax=Microbacterium sp. G2-8 TaxID=2842454 RepID=UPI001C891A71|nr:PH domain-containing protein [Microbacterium sp. G2-8]